jgi:exopolysaccharide biosynthesis polyprenyl glycosylphosphotransferase
MVLRLALILADAAVAASAFALVSLLRFGDGGASEIWRERGLGIEVAAVLFAIVWVLALWFSGLYRLRVRWRLVTEARDMAKATGLVIAVTLSALFLSDADDVSRSFLLILFVVQPIVALVSRTVLRFSFGAIRRRGFNTRYMLIIGTGHLARTFAELVERRPALGIEVIGHISVPGERDSYVSRPILGSLGMLKAILHSRVIDEVAVCLPPTALEHLEPLCRLAADEGKTVRIPLDPLHVPFASAVQEEFDGFLVRSLVRDDQRALGLIVKRLIDVVGASVLLVLASPVLAAIACAIRIRDGSPVLFRQRRIALHGRPFTIYKFRTMVPDAEARLGEVAHLNIRVGHAFKAANDPRVTPIGAFLRRTSLDELPQLWNVLRGEMSLVGPRPPLPHEVDQYDVWHRRRLSMKPGMTGLWQIEAREAEQEFDRWVERDLSYIDRWSLTLDLEIMIKTVPVVVLGQGR